MLVPPSVSKGRVPRLVRWYRVFLPLLKSEIVPLAEKTSCAEPFLISWYCSQGWIEAVYVKA